jgi:hypothetical protein
MGDIEEKGEWVNACRQHGFIRYKHRFCLNCKEVAEKGDQNGRKFSVPFYENFCFTYNSHCILCWYFIIIQLRYLFKTGKAFFKKLF